MISPDPGDLTPSVASPTDIAPAGHITPKPPHERTADEEAGSVDWNGIAALPEFKSLLARKARFIVPACIIFLVYYFALPLLVAYDQDLMKKAVGPVNLAYLFALSQFFMAWIIAALYVRAANRFDRDAKAVIGKRGEK